MIRWNLSTATYSHNPALSLLPSFSKKEQNFSEDIMLKLQTKRLFRHSVWGGVLAATGSCGLGLERRNMLTATSCLEFSAIEKQAIVSPPELDAWSWRSEQGILKSSLDNRSYRYIVLNNGLKVLLVHDSKADKAAAAMSVNVGASQDPAIMPGLAHFCEHMLFLGTQAYPIENAYKSYLAKHGGRSNASTSMEATIFQFEVGSSHLKGALDIFSNFFIEPLFTESATDRELRAVDSEDSKNRTDDGRRMLQVLKALADSAHPYSKYSTGNIKTLRDDLPPEFDTRTELLNFHKAHYYASNMGCAIVGKESLDELEQWATEFFSGITPFPLSGDFPTEKVVDEVLESSTSSPSMNSPFKLLPLQVELEPLRDSRKIYIQWPLPPQRQLWRQTPSRLLGHLWGSESPGSLFSVLQDKGLANSVSAGVRICSDDFSLFQVAISLTEKGEMNSDDVIQLVHQYSSLLQEMTDSEAVRLWAEVKAMADLDFRFSSEIPPYSYTTSISRRLQLYPPAEVLSAGSLLQSSPDLVLLRDFMQYFKPENTITWRIFKGATRSDESAKIEKWYGVPFSSSNVPQEKIKLWTSATIDSKLFLPEQNEFIPDRFEILEDIDKKYDFGQNEQVGMLSMPQLLEGRGIEKKGDELIGQLWHKVDDKFKQPRACINLLLATPEANDGSAVRSSHMNLLIGTIQKILAQSTYAASIAGLSWGLSQHPHGIMLSVFGYNQKVAPLIFTVLRALIDPETVAGSSEELVQSFNDMQEATVKRLKSFNMTRPDELAEHYISLAMLQGRSSLPSRLLATESARFEDVMLMRDRLLKRVHPMCFIHGNVSESEAKEMFWGIRRMLGEFQARSMGEDEFLPIRVSHLPEGRRVRLRVKVDNETELNSAYAAYWQLGERTDKLAASTMVLSSIMREPCFNSLRTKQQLGYVVFSGLRTFGQRGLMRGLYIRILSKDFCPDVLAQRVDEFMLDFRQHLLDMSEDSFQHHLQSLVDKQLESPKTLNAEFSLLYNELETSEYRWDRYVRAAEQISSLTKNDIIELIDTSILSPSKVKRMDVYVYGNSHEPTEVDQGKRPMEEGEIIEIGPEEVEKFRESLDVLDTSIMPPAELRKYIENTVST